MSYSDKADHSSDENVQPQVHVQVQQTDQDGADAIEELGLSLDEGGFVRWKADCPDHPRNWTVKRRAFDTGLIFMFDLFTLVFLQSRPSSDY